MMSTTIIVKINMKVKMGFVILISMVAVYMMTSRMDDEDGMIYDKEANAIREGVATTWRG